MGSKNIERRKLVEKLGENFEKAVEIARRYGRIIGWVSRTSPSLINEEGGYIVFDVDPETYFFESQELASSGNYLAVVDLKSLHIISLRVLSVERRDILSELELPELSISLPGRDVAGLLTKTRIKAKPLLSYDPFNDVVEIANYVIEPQSPVIKPLDTRVVHKILGLPDKGVFLGYATVGDKPVFELSAEVFLPIKAFYQHVLVLGTTGSGKTTLLKNMISSISSQYNIGDEKVSVIIIDPNRDYVSLPIKPQWVMTSGLDVKLEKTMIEKAGKKISYPKGLVVLVPITREVIEYLDIAELTWAKALMEISKKYFEDTYNVIAERMGWQINIVDTAIREEPGDTRSIPLRYVYFKVEIDYGDQKDSFELYIVPYGFRFKELSTKEFIVLNPYFTRQARDSLLRLMNYLKSKGIELESIDELYDALREARYYYEKKKEPTTASITNPRIRILVELIKDLAIHKSTIENMIRQVGSLIETGLFDIMVKGGKGEDKYLHEPPIYRLLEKHHSIFKGYPIVLDLEYLQEHSISDPEKVISIAAFRVLNKVFEWKITSSRKRIITQPVLIIIDEAHRFFPSRSGKEDYIEHVSSMIDRIARLGRARRLGIIFSTHSPKDVHDIILQLTNTKIVLRMDKSQVSSLDIPSEYRELILRSSDRVGVVKSHILRLGYISFRTPLPLAGHYDLSVIE